MTAAPPPVAILGTGALAMRFGAVLGRAGHPVTLVGTWAAGLAALAAHGIAVDGDGRVAVGARHLDDVVVDRTRGGRPAAEGAATPVPAAPIVLVLVKSHQTARVAPAAARLAAADGLVVTLQNGLGNAEALAAAAGADRVAVGVTTLGAAVVGAGRVRLGGDGTVTIGRTPATAGRVDALVAWLGAAGLEAAAVGDIAPAVWRKLAVNCAINPLSAVLGVPNGRLLDDPDAHAMLRAAADEVGAVARALGVAVDDDLAALAEAVADRTAANRSSMLQDVERGAPTEIDAINGAVVRAGRAVGVATPVNEALWRAIAERPVAPTTASPAR